MIIDSQWSFWAYGTEIKCSHHKTMSNIDDISVPRLLNELPHSLTIFDEWFLLLFLLLLLLPWLLKAEAWLPQQTYPGNHRAPQTSRLISQGCKSCLLNQTHAWAWSLIITVSRRIQISFFFLWIAFFFSTCVKTNPIFIQISRRIYGISVQLEQ